MLVTLISFSSIHGAKNLRNIIFNFFGRSGDLFFLHFFISLTNLFNN